MLNTINILKKMPLKYKIYYISNKDVGIKSLKRKTTRFPRYKLFQLFLSLNKKDVLINLGGIFQDKTGFLSFLFYFFVNLIFILKKTKVLSLSIDISDLKKSISNYFFKYIVKKSSLTVVRNKYSYDKLKNFKNVHYASDIGFLSKKSRQIKRSNITIIILKYKKGIENFLKFTNEENIFYIVMPDDYKRLSRYFSNDNYWIYNGDMERFIRYIKRARNVISMRLHPGIIAILYATPLKFLSDEKKIIHFANDNNIDIIEKVKKNIDILKFKRYIKISDISKYNNEWNWIKLQLRKIIF